MNKFDEITVKINEAKNASACRAELAYLINKFDPAQLARIEQDTLRGIDLIEEWLPKYKFKDWNETETNKKKVDEDLKEERAGEIAEILAEGENWHSHTRGISMVQLRDIGLRIDDFDEDPNPDLGNLIKHYHGLAVDFYTRGHKWIGYIHSNFGHRRII